MRGLGKKPRGFTSVGDRGYVHRQYPLAGRRDTYDTRRDYYVGDLRLILWKEGDTYNGIVESTHAIEWIFYGYPAAGVSWEDISHIAVDMASDPKWNVSGTAEHFAEAAARGRVDTRKRSSGKAGSKASAATSRSSSFMPGSVMSMMKRNPEDWRARRRKLDNLAYRAAELRDANAPSAEWAEFQEAVHAMNRRGELDNDDTEYVLSEVARLRGARSNPSRGRKRLPFNVEAVETVDGTWMVLVDGIQHGGKRDRSGAGDLVFGTKREAEEYAHRISKTRNPRGHDPVLTLEDLIEQLELWNENTDGYKGGEDVYVAVWDDDPDPDKNEWTITQFFSQRELEKHKRQYGGRYAKVRIPGHDKPFNAHRAAAQAMTELGLRILNPRRR